MSVDIAVPPPSLANDEEKLLAHVRSVLPLLADLARADVLIALRQRFTPMATPSLPPYDDTRLLNEAALLVDWYLPAITGEATASSLRAEYLDLDVYATGERMLIAR